VASYRGRAVHPLWYENLLVHPGVVVQIRDDVFAARAEPVTDPGQRRRLWTLMVELHPTYAEYQAATSREIPVIRLARC
jgi:F420H(2)-dependent quinone reductase